MAGQITVVFNQIIIFAILMVIGFAAAKAGILTADALKALSGLIVKLILPALIFTVVAGSGASAGELLIGGRFAAGVVLCYALLYLAGNVLSRLCGLEGRTANVFVALMVFGNMGFIGIPLIQGIFKGTVAQVCISVYTLIDMTLLWTFGVYLCSRHHKKYNFSSALKNILNPTTGALLAAFAILLLGIPVPDLLMSAISGVGDSSKYLALIYLGGALAYVSAGGILKKPSIFVLAAGKMLILPLIIYVLSGLFLPQTPRTILALISGLPSMTAIAMMAEVYGTDAEYATEVIFVTTLAGLFTIPVISFITM